jgi:hypothetical protein
MVLRTSHRSLARHALGTVSLLTCLFWHCVVAFAQATTPQFFFETPGQTPTSYIQGVSSQSVAANGNVTLSVWLQYQPSSTTTFYGADVFVGFDQTNLAGSTATPQNNTVTLPGGLNATSAVTNLNPAFTDISNVLGGGQDPASSPTPSSAVRPYGDDIQIAGMAGFGPSTAQPIHLFDIQLHNAALGSGGSQQIAIYSSDPAGHATDFTTYLDNGGGDASTFARPASSTILSLFQPADTGALPEPGTWALVLLPGIALFGARATRRRSGKMSRHGFPSLTFPC